MMVGSLIYECWIVVLGAVVGVGQISNGTAQGRKTLSGLEGLHLG